MTTILLVDDEPALATVVGYNLRRDGYEVRTAANGAEALATARQSPPQLVLLDVMLPLVDGFEVCRLLRESADARLRTVPVLMFSARGDEIDRVVGLEVGADDYVSKPFAMRELLARVRALLRRARGAAGAASAASATAALTAGDVEGDPVGRIVRRGGREVVLKPREFDLLHFLLRHPGRVFTRERLLARVWTDGDAAPAGAGRTVDVHVRRLREKLEADPAAPALLETVWGIGYRSRGPDPRTFRPRGGALRHRPPAAPPARPATLGAR